MNLYLKDTYILNNYTYGIYIPDTHKIEKQNDTLTIQILSIYDESEYNCDILESELNKEGLVLEDENLEDFKIYDIISINSKEFTKIIDIKENQLILENMPELMDKEKIYVMNMNLQNTLIFY